MSQISQWLLQDGTLRSTRDRANHFYVIGQPGTGKSRALESWIMQDVVNGHGVCVIDPHGDLFSNLIVRLSFIPQVWERIVMINPSDTEWVTTINPLDAISGYSQQRLSNFLTDIIGKIWRLDLAGAPRTMWLLSNTFLALSNLNLTLLHLPMFLLDQEYRERLMLRMTDPRALSFFHYEYPKTSAAAHQWASPVLNKIGTLIFDPDLSLMLAGKPRISFREILDQQLILLVNLPKGIIGEGASALIGAFIVAHIQKAALSRTNSQVRAPFYLYLDEFQNYTTDNIIDILAESRKYALSMTLAHQYLEQLTPEIRNALINTAGSIACFRVGYQDGHQLAKEIFPRQDYLESHLQSHVFVMPQIFPHAFMKQDVSQGWERLTQELSGLGPREFWFKQRGAYLPTKQRTIDMPMPRLTNGIQERIQEMLATSRRYYSRPRSVLEKEVQSYGLDGFGNNQATRSDQAINQDDNVSFWGV